MSRVFISYKHCEPDAAIANALDHALTEAGHQVFVDVKMTVGVEWGKRIEEELGRTDALIALLSQHSVRSEMMIGEIGTAYRLKKRLLPVRLAYQVPFEYPLSAWLNPVNWAFWNGPDDTPRVAAELSRALESGGDPDIDQHARQAGLSAAQEAGPFPPPRPLASLEPQSGTMGIDSPLYIPRASDALALATIGRKGQTLSIKGARQMGKSSLLMRVLDAAASHGKRVAFIDCQDLDYPTLQSADLFFRRFCAEISNQLDLADQTDKYWDPALKLGNVQRSGKYLGEYVLRSLGAPLTLALDEVDRLQDSLFRSDFFGMVRSWHGKRALPTVPAWKGLDLVLVSSTEPNLLIDNLNQSPFNVGERLELSAFSPEEMDRLNQLHGALLDPPQVGRLTALVGGQPYLARQALYLIASGRTRAQDLLEYKDLEGGPFGDHLRHLLFLLNGREELISGLREVLLHGTCADRTVLFRLRSAGLIRQTGGGVAARCELYERYFRMHLLG